MASAYCAASVRPEIRGFHLRIADQSGCGIGADDLPGFQHISPVGDGECQRRDLIDQQDRYALVAQLREDVEQFVDDRRRQPQRRLVQEQHPRQRHHPARDGQHLLLAAGKQPGAAGQAFTQARKPLQQLRDHQVDVGAGARVGPEHQIVVDGQVGEHLPPFGHQREAGGGDLVCLKAGDVPVVQQDVAFDRPQQARQRAHDGGFARAIGADHAPPSHRGGLRAKRCPARARRHSRRKP